MNRFKEKASAGSSFNRMRNTIVASTHKVSQWVKPVEKLATTGSYALGFVPQQIQASALEPLLNHALQELIDTGEFDYLEGYCCAIAVRERQLSWHICFDGGRLKVRPEREPDVTISATVPAFLDLISQRADPDTLFFKRQLSIEGSVELGLHVKNMLDALDEDELPYVWQKGLNSLRQLLALEARED